MRRFLRRCFLVSMVVVVVAALILHFAYHDDLTQMVAAGRNAVIGKATPTSLPPAPPRPSQRGDMGSWPFQSHSPWNVPLSRAAIDEPSSSPCSASFHSPRGGPTSLSAATWSHAVFFAHATDPWADIYYNSTFVPGGAKVATIRVPTDAVPAPPPASAGGDARLYIIDPTQHFVDEMWKAQRNADGSWIVAGYHHTDLYGTGIGAGGTRAFGGSGLGGLIRIGEFNGKLSYPRDAQAMQHAIPHAIPIAMRRLLEKNTWVWPAISNDVHGRPDPEYQGVVPMGQLVTLPPDLDVTKLGLQTPQGLELAYALQNYGAYLVDSSDNYAYYAETGAADEIGQINDALQGHQPDIVTLQNLLVCIDGNGPQTPGGGPIDNMPRRACWAPWLPTEVPVSGQCVLDRSRH